MPPLSILGYLYGVKLYYGEYYFVGGWGEFMTKC